MKIFLITVALLKKVKIIKRMAGKTFDRKLLNYLNFIS